MFGFFKSKTWSKRWSRRLQGGNLSAVSQAACNDAFVHKCFDDAAQQECKFGTVICLLFYRSAEILIRKIEQDRELVSFYRKTSRDVLVFEAFVFYHYAISRLMRGYMAREWHDSLDHYTRLAAEAGTSIAKNNHGQFDADAHRERRLKQLSKYKTDPMQMTETFSGVLLTACGKQHVDDPDAQLCMDLRINLKVRLVAHAVSSLVIPASCESIKRIYDHYFEPGRHEMSA